MPKERRSAVDRTRQLLVDILSHKYEDDYHDLWYTARQCLKHYPGEYDMESAAEKAPDIFGEWNGYNNKG